ncbi:MAG: protein phosphatase 2C domain-containing protein [Verrucomicrobiota bacterium]|nr:protein phosphatase 2C domain-containing protein [Verrucomicrobiota bacterium]
MNPNTPPLPIPSNSLNWSGMTHPGKVRKNNEDAFLALTVDGHYVQFLGKIGEAPLANADFIFAVSDGLGGHNAGEFASKIAVERITRLLPKSFRAAAQGLTPAYQEILEQIFLEIHEEIILLGRSYEECKGMGATLSLAWFTPTWMHFCHIGDSRIYYLPKAGGIKQLTHDHTHVGWLRKKGEINEREARFHPRKNLLSQSLGAGHQIVRPQLGAVGHEPGDRFLLCSDGLIDGHWDRALNDTIREPNPATANLPHAQRLVEAAIANDGHDNTTAVVVEVG